MRLKSIELAGFKSFAKKTPLSFDASIVAVVGPNGSGKSNVAESFRFVLGEQSMKSMRGKRGEDLIWNGSASSPRGNRASVKLVFDNRAVGGKRALNLDFDEVSLERVVHRDGTNDYLLNGSQVRLRDIAELLSGANVGSSGHHIISQGEADRVLSASSRERREMLEDALGLTAFLYKREEAERKLEKSEENIKEVEGLRRELAPHLKFLQSQVKKIEQAEVLREQLAADYAAYFKRESVYLKTARAELEQQSDTPEKEHKELGRTIERLRANLSKKTGDAGAHELVSLEERGRLAARRQGEITRELGRLEGEIAAHARLAGSESVPAAEARDFGEKILSLAEGSKLAELIALARQFLHTIAQSGKSDLPDLEAKKKKLEHELAEVTAEEERVRREVATLRQKIEGEKDASREAERGLFAAMARRSELETTLARLRGQGELLARDESLFKSDLAEAAALAGRAVLDYADAAIDIDDEPRSAQEDRRRKLERQKIRLEESGTAGSGDVLKEHQEVTERDAFLSRELADLAASMESLNKLIDELTKTLETRFGDGIEKINKQFDAFFKLMFGGGSASLQIVKEQKLRRVTADVGDDTDEDDIEVEEGVEISIALPHKRLKGIHMLSGGERALTSIALIFAMSQVNPPPFLILDETDAALDEANSRRYGDMIETLAKHSQLIVITHNRETMSRAGILYGVTMGQDSISKLLTVKFEDALAVAK
ncbi:MAG: AAA family ATPase [Patescibacteria group bacterium]